MSEDIKRPLWLRLFNRLVTWILNTFLWFGLWLGVFVLVFNLVLSLRDTTLFELLPAWSQWPVEMLLRALIGIPFTLWMVLMIHPIRTRWWLIRRLPVLGRLLQRPWRIFQRRVAPSTQVELVEVAAPVQAATLPKILQPTEPPRPMSRRRFLLESGLVGGVMAYSLLIEPETIQTITVDLPVPNLPSRFDGLRIAQVSDLHVNAYTTSEDVARAVAAINRLAPDMVVITGDIVDRDAKYADDAARPFRAIQAPEGIFTVVGNHDYYTNNIEAVKAAIRRYDLGLLVNQHTVLRRGADRLTLVGLDDPRHNRGADRYSYESINPEKALRGASASDPRLTLVHNPVIIPDLVSRYRLDVVLSGHTHGGQFQVPILTSSLIKAREYFVHGRYDLGHTQVYVNRGIGFTGPPIRFRAAPEVTLIRLVAAT